MSCTVCRKPALSRSKRIHCLPACLPGLVDRSLLRVADVNQRMLAVIGAQQPPPAELEAQVSIAPVAPLPTEAPLRRGQVRLAVTRSDLTDAHD